LKSLLPANWLDYSVAEIAQITPLQTLQWPLVNNLGIDIIVKREDLLHPFLSGNKFYKLHGHLRAFSADSSKDKIITFGGAYSNHIYAAASAGQLLGIPMWGVIRGERPKILSPTLVDAQSMGMTLIFVSRSDYKKKNDPHWLRQLLGPKFDDFYFIPEGGGDIIGSQGCSIWAKNTVLSAPWRPTHLCLGVGTGGTLAGVHAIAEEIITMGFLSINIKDLEGKVKFLDEVLVRSGALKRQSEASSSDDQHSPRLETDYHCGGYGKFPGYLRDFVQDFEKLANIPLDPVYTAKVFWGIAQKAKQGEWPEQGCRGFS